VPNDTRQNTTAKYRVSYSHLSSITYRYKTKTKWRVKRLRQNYFCNNYVNV